MKDLLTKETFTEKDIQDLIDNEIEESIYLDFKAGEALGKSDGKRKEISKDVSAFANSDGGVIIYGLNEKNHKAHSFSFIDGNEFTKEWLEQIISSTIQRKISNLKIIPVRFENNIEKTVYIVKIPKSFETPHMCKDNRFYRRYNFESVQMEEYEIRELYSRKTIAKLQVEPFDYGKKTEEENTIISFEFHVFNEGEIPEESYKLNVYFNNFNKYINLSWDREKTNYDYTIYPNHRVKVSAQNRLTIYPTERLTIMRFKMEIETIYLEEALKNLDMEMILFYSNGDSKLNDNLNDFRTYVLETE